MVRGCQKKIIYLKNTQSNIFEEAYFVIKDDLSCEKTEEYDMVKEANRILAENFEFEEKSTFFGRIIRFFKRHTVSFVTGVAIGILIMIIF